MHRFASAALAAVIAFAPLAQSFALTIKPNVAPTSTQVANQTQYIGTRRSLDLTTAFTDPDASAAVRLTTSLGVMNFTLDGQTTPITVANFLNYVDSGRYLLTDPTNGQLASLIFHRSLPGFIIQSGGFIGTVNSDGSGDAVPTEVSRFAAIQNEPLISNQRGTLAMAKVDGNPDSATSNWFINLANNAHFNNSQGQDIGLDVQNGGFTVFGRVAGSGMAVADSIAALPTPFHGANSVFADLPLRDYTSPNRVKVPNLVSIPELTRISPLQFSASSNNTAVATVSVSGTNLLIDAHQVGAALITVTATDLDGASVSQSFTVNGIAMPGHLANISTRLQVGTNQDVLIGGFIVRGGTSKRLLIRGLGPSLAANGQPVAGRMADPVLELHDRFGATIATNNNWGDSNAQQIIDTGVAPASSLESAILLTVPSSSDGIPYSAILKGMNSTTGIGIVEVFDLDSGPGSLLVNISTRGKVGTDLNVMIGGFIITGADSKRVLIRGIGPSLGAGGVTAPLANPTIELHDGNGAQIDANDDWQSSPQKAEIEATGVAPSDPKESAMLRLLPPGAYTAVVKGVSNTTGVALVEVYQLQ